MDSNFYSSLNMHDEHCVVWLASKLTLQSTGENRAKLMRLRKVFQAHLGIKSDPFEKFRKGAGWVPLFKVFDKRGAADERAKREGEFRTESLDQRNERGRQSFKPEEPDAAERWLREYDPDA